MIRYLSLPLTLCLTNMKAVIFSIICPNISLSINISSQIEKGNFSLQVSE